MYLFSHDLDYPIEDLPRACADLLALCAGGALMGEHVTGQLVFSLDGVRDGERVRYFSAAIEQGEVILHRGDEQIDVPTSLLTTLGAMPLPDFRRFVGEDETDRAMRGLWAHLERGER
jgi:hypothetical protein